MKSIWKQCDVAQSGSDEGTNVCLMWDCPGRCNCCLYKEERDGEEGIKKVIKRARQLVEAVQRSPFLFFFFFFCVNVSAATLPIWPSPPFDVCSVAWPMKTKTHQHQPPPFLGPVCLCCCVWLASAGRRVKGRGPPGPTRKTRGSQTEAGMLSRGALRIAVCIPDCTQLVKRHVQ